MIDLCIPVSSVKLVISSEWQDYQSTFWTLFIDNGIFEDHPDPRASKDLQWSRSYQPKDVGKTKMSTDGKDIWRHQIEWAICKKSSSSDHHQKLAYNIGRPQVSRWLFRTSIKKSKDLLQCGSHGICSISRKYKTSATFLLFKIRNQKVNSEQFTEGASLRFRKWSEQDILQSVVKSSSSCSGNQM